MWVSIVLFGMGLTGLLALFLCKHLERTRAVETPLTAMRRSVDPLIAGGWRRWKEQFRAHTVSIFYRSSALCKQGAHEAGRRLHGLLHSLSVQFGEYLKRNGASGEKNGNASPYVKNMLEYKRNAEHTRLPAEASAQAGTDTDSTPVAEQRSLRGTARTEAQTAGTEDGRH